MRTEASYGGVEPYGTLSLKAAAVCCGLIGNHGFVDGNKRAGVAAMLLILRKNGLRIGFTQGELVALGLSVARGEMREVAVAEWIKAHRVEE
jgi:death-on-curing protein